MTNHFKLVILGILAFLILIIINTWLMPPQEKDKTKGTVELVYVEWDSEVASAHVIRVVLEELGYQVKMFAVSAAAMWQAVASGDKDALVAAWLPTTHGHYLKKVENQVENLGPNLQGTQIGLVVPQYVPFNSIEELNANANQLHGKIIGIDPGAGLMSKTESVMEEYNLDQLKLVEGSGATMTVTLADAIKNQQWIVVTGWTPHWKFNRWPLKYLQDPKGIYGEKEYISTIVRKGLKEDMPEVYRVLDNFFWTPTDMEQIMVMNLQSKTKPYPNAKRWVKENPDKVKQWISQ